MPEIEQPPGRPQPPAVRPPDGPAATAPSQPGLPAHPHPPGPRAPLDPELVRQFQQFQQFQELMRQHPEALPAQLPPAQRPLWQRILRRKLVRRLALLAILLLTLPLWWNLLLAGVVKLATLAFGSKEPDRPASETGGGLYHTNHILKDDPYDAVRQVYQRVADNSPAFACGVFTDQAAQQFAEHFNAADCPAAIARLNGEVDTSPGSKNAYAEPANIRGKLGQVPSADTVTISSCDLGVRAGPRLGAFTVSRRENGQLLPKDQWIITGHQRESC